MTKPSAARCRAASRSGCAAALGKRGCLPAWLDAKTSRLAPPEGRLGRPAVFREAAIRFRLPIELPSRRAVGVVAPCRGGRGWPAPDFPAPHFPALRRRRKPSAVQVPPRRADGPLELLADGAGIELLGDGG